MPLSDFRKKVLAVVRKIPPGEVMSYRQVAVLSGKPKAARAVGSILSTNYDPEIPCHRVIKADGTLSGYNRGAELKLKILNREGYVFKLND